MSDDKKPEETEKKEQAENPTPPKRSSPKSSAAKKPARYFIVNPAGAVHEVTREHATQRLRQVGWRKATKAEVEQYLNQRVQKHDRPIAEPFSPEPEAFEEDLE